MNKTTGENQVVAIGMMLVGAWLIISQSLAAIPVLVRFNAIIMGLILMAIGILDSYTVRGWYSLVASLIGVWLVLIPELFKLPMTAAWDSIALGSLVVVLSMWNGAIVQQITQYKFGIGGPDER